LDEGRGIAVARPTAHQARVAVEAHPYLDEVIKLLPDLPTADFISRLWRRFSALGGIRLPSRPPNAA